MTDNRGTISPAEHAVLEVLRDGPAALGAVTEVTRVLRLAALNDQDVVLGRLGAKYAEGARDVRTVESKAARRLARDGYVAIDAGGTATLTDKAAT